MRKPQTSRLVVWMSAALLALAAAGLIVRALASRAFGDVQLIPDVEFRLPADRLLTVAGFPVTNALLSSWGATLAVIGLFAAGRWRSRLVPSGLRNLAGWVLDTVLEYVMSIAGREHAPRLFAIAATLFLFIIANAWVPLLPLYGPLVAERGDGSHVPLLRGAGTDINMSLALAIVSFIVVEAAGLMVLRASYLRRFVRVGNLLRGRLLLGLLDLFTGCLEALMELARLLTFTLRLFGSLTAGEVLVVVATFLAPLVLSVPFYGLELLIGLVQALVFASLTVVFAVRAMTPEETELLEEPHA